MQEVIDVPAVSASLREEERTVRASDGYPLAATLYPVEGARTAVLVNPATAVPRGFYRRYARYLQARGWQAVTYDYRGIGGSRRGSLRGFEARMRDWALLDMTAMIRWVTDTLEPGRLFAVGHSFGGQVLGMVENGAAVAAMLGVSAQSGHWRVQGGREPAKVRFAVTVMIPLLARLFGYFPWSLVARGEDLPKGVALEWARWCRRRNYLLDDPSLPLERYRQFEAPVLSLSIDDDDWGTRRAVDEMMRAYRNVSRRHIRPGDYGMDRMGHMGFFREAAMALWRETADWLDRAVS